MSQSIHPAGVACLCLAMLSGATAAPFDPQQAAKDAQAPVKAAGGTPAAMNSNMVQPITNNTVPLKNFDNTTSFNAALGCPSTKSFMEIFVGVTPTGDLSPVILSQDATYSGALTTSYTLPYIVSGICANGVISCDAGTWSNCNYYQWVSTPQTCCSSTPPPLTSSAHVTASTTIAARTWR